jgi:hypothetical protein
MSGINPYSIGLVFLYHSITFLKDLGSLNSKSDFERLIPGEFYHAKSLTMTEKEITSSNFIHRRTHASARIHERLFSRFLMFQDLDL